jgi:hypothetical protein
MPTTNRFLLTRAVSYSACLAAATAGAPLRGSIHSAFNAAANIAFPGGLVLSLNALDSPRMPNGLEISAQECPRSLALSASSSNPPIARLIFPTARCGIPLSTGQNT